MKAPCVTHADSNPYSVNKIYFIFIWVFCLYNASHNNCMNMFQIRYLMFQEFVGSVLNVATMTCVQYAIMVINIT